MIDTVGSPVAQENFLTNGNGFHTATVATVLSESVPKGTLTPHHSSADFLASLYEPMRDLGSGSFSTVRLARERSTAHKRVCKDVRMAQMAIEAVEFTKQEMVVLAELDHPHIVKLFEFAEDLERQQLLLVLEYIPGGDCSELLKTAKAAGCCLKEETVVDLVRQLLVALSYCHSRHVIHRDIKPENVMLIRRGSDPDCMFCKVIDFGLATLEPRSRAFVGTPAYMSPEMVVGAVDYTSLTDIWSLGVTTIELLTGIVPFGRPEDFGSMDVVFDKIKSFGGLADIEEVLRKKTPDWRGRSKPSHDFIRWMLQPMSTRRPQAPQAITHEWFEAYNELPTYEGLSSDMIASMVAFAGASPLIRACLVVIAARKGAYGKDAEISKAFIDADVDYDGYLSKEELRETLTAGSSCWKVSNAQMRQLLGSLDMHQSVGLSYTEFCAACLYKNFESEDAIAIEAFNALDHDRDHQVLLMDIQHLFAAPVLPFLQPLPKDRHFTCLEWRKCVANSARLQTGARQQASPPAAASGPELRRTDPFTRWLQTFFLCGGCEPMEGEDTEETNYNCRYDPCSEAVEDYEHCSVAHRYDPCSEADDFTIHHSSDFYTPRYEESAGLEAP